MGFPLLLSAVMGASDAKPQPSDEVKVAAGGSRYWVLVGAVLVQIVLGTIYAFSVFVQPLETEFGWARTTTQWAYSLALATFALAMIPAGRLQDRIGPRKVAMIGGALLGVSFLLAAVLVARQPARGRSTSPTASSAAPASASPMSAPLPPPASGSRTRRA